jgi:anti-anti-sigma factor
VVEQPGQRVSLVLVGEVDSTNADVVDDHLVQATPAGGGLSEIVIDMSGVTFIDSYGLDVLVRHRRQLDESTALVIENPSDHLRRLLEITALDGLFEIRTS